MARLETIISNLSSIFSNKLDCIKFISACKFLEFSLPTDSASLLISDDVTDKRIFFT